MTENIESIIFIDHEYTKTLETIYTSVTSI